MVIRYSTDIAAHMFQLLQTIFRRMYIVFAPIPAIVDFGHKPIENKRDPT